MKPVSDDSAFTPISRIDRPMLPLTTPGETTERTARQTGRVALLMVFAAFVLVSAPVVFRGALLADDFHNCVAASQLGLAGFFAASWDFLGLVRPARFLEILVTAGVCGKLPFGVAIAVPLSLTFAVALLARGLLRDLGTPPPWPDLAGALWLLQPLGTEAGLWPAALHVPLGLTLTLLALRLFSRGRVVGATVASIGAVLSLEQVILALPVAAWLLLARPNRRGAVIATGCVAVITLIAFSVGGGSDPRLRTPVADRLLALTDDPIFFATYPAVGLGLHSIPLAIRWAFPWSLLVLGGGLAAGILAATRLPSEAAPIPWRRVVTGLGALILVAGVLNVFVFLNVPRYGSPRLFAPTWLALAVGVPLIASQVRLRGRLVAGAVAGLFAAGAVLSLALSVRVRLVSADFSERMARAIAAQVPDGGTVAVCGVRRAVMTLAPRGAYSLHEFVYDWSARDALEYYTGRRATFQLAGELWGDPCPDPSTVDAVIRFDAFLPDER